MVAPCCWRPPLPHFYCSSTWVFAWAPFRSVVPPCHIACAPLVTAASLSKCVHGCAWRNPHGEINTCQLAPCCCRSALPCTLTSSLTDPWDCELSCRQHLILWTTAMKNWRGTEQRGCLVGCWKCDQCLIRSGNQIYIDLSLPAWLAH